MTASDGSVVCLVLAGLAACSGGADERAARPQKDRMECADVVADPVFQGQAEVVAEFKAAGQPTLCTLEFEAGSPVIAAIGVADVCSSLPFVAVSIDDGAWAVDSAQTDRLTAENC
jgi:hypothetical protein